MARIQKGDAGDAHSHADLDQMYFVLDGAATFRVGSERVELKKHLAVYVPRKTEHQVEKVHEDLMYICVSVKNKFHPEAGEAKKSWGAMQIQGGQ